MSRSMSTRLLLAVLLAASAFACGGGGDSGGGTVPTRVATFAPADPTPPSNSVSLQSGSQSADTVTIRVSATDVNDFFGAGFRVTFDPASLVFLGMSSAGSFLRDGGVPNANLLFTTDAISVPGAVLVSATRLQNQTGTLTGVNVNGTRELVSLTFLATADTAGNTLSLPAPREVCDSDTPICNPIGVGWFGGTVTAY